MLIDGLNHTTSYLLGRYNLALDVIYFVHYLGLLKNHPHRNSTKYNMRMINNGIQIGDTTQIQSQLISPVIFRPISITSNNGDKYFIMNKLDGFNDFL